MNQSMEAQVEQDDYGGDSQFVLMTIPSLPCKNELSIRFSKTEDVTLAPVLGEMVANLQSRNIIGTQVTLIIDQLKIFSASSPTNCKLIAALGGFSVFFNLMRRYLVVPAIVTKILTLINEIASSDKSCLLLAEKEDHVPFLINCWRNYISDPDVLSLLAEFMDRISLSDDSVVATGHSLMRSAELPQEFVPIPGKSNTIEIKVSDVHDMVAVLDIMKRHIDNLDIVMNCCAIIYQHSMLQSTQTTEARRVLNASNSLHALTDLLMAMGMEQSEIATMCMKSIGLLSISPVNKEVLGEQALTACWVISHSFSNLKPLVIWVISTLISGNSSNYNAAKLIGVAPSLASELQNSVNTDHHVTEESFQAELVFRIGNFFCLIVAEDKEVVRLLERNLMWLVKLIRKYMQDYKVIGPYLALLEYLLDDEVVVSKARSDPELKAAVQMVIEKYISSNRDVAGCAATILRKLGIDSLERNNLRILSRAYTRGDLEKNEASHLDTLVHELVGETLRSRGAGPVAPTNLPNDNIADGLTFVSRSDNAERIKREYVDYNKRLILKRRIAAAITIQRVFKGYRVRWASSRRKIGERIAQAERAKRGDLIRDEEREWRWVMMQVSEELRQAIFLLDGNGPKPQDKNEFLKRLVQEKEQALSLENELSRKQAEIRSAAFEYLSRNNPRGVDSLYDLVSKSLESDTMLDNRMEFVRARLAQKKHKLVTPGTCDVPLVEAGALALRKTHEDEAVKIESLKKELEAMQKENFLKLRKELDEMDTQFQRQLREASEKKQRQRLQRIALIEEAEALEDRAIAIEKYEREQRRAWEKEQLRVKLKRAQMREEWDQEHMKKRIQELEREHQIRGEYIRRMNYIAERRERLFLEEKDRILKGV